MRVKMQAPPALATGQLRVMALGGLGDIGRNMTVFEIDGDLLIVDCGVMFPTNEQPGVDVLLPGFHLVEDRLDRVTAMVLTHGHEDHIGAVPYLLRSRPDIPVYGTRFTIALVADKLKQHNIRDHDLNVVTEGDRIQLGAFNLEFLSANHSIPDGVAVAIRTVAGTVLHTGDFKLDQLPLDGRLTDLNAFARLGDEGVDLFLVDSTNADTKGFVASELELAPVIDRVFASAPAKLIVVTFASHVHRVQQVIDAAVRHGRKVAYVGRSMVRNMTAARELGYLKVPRNTLIDLKDLDSFRDNEVVVISTGSQGEPLSALARIANQEHPVITAKPGDTVLLASSMIPGNEQAVFRMVNGLMRNGVEVVHPGNSRVHVSGHANAGELLYCYNLVKPRNVMPVHGEVRHLIANGELAISTGVEPSRVIIAQDGTVVDLVNQIASITGQLECGYIHVDGSTLGDLGVAELADRKMLGLEGCIWIVSVVNFKDGTVVGKPEIKARGFLADESIFDQIRQEIADKLARALQAGADDTHQLEQAIARLVGQWASRTLGRRPLVVPVVMTAWIRS